MRLLGVIGAGVFIWATSGTAWGQLRDLGVFGATCPIVAATPVERPKVPVSLPERPPEDLRLTTRLTFAPGQRARRVLQSRVPWPPGTPTTLVFAGTDPESLTMVRALPPGSAIYLVALNGWKDVRTVQGLCPRCLVQVGGDETAALFGITRYPALLHWTGRELVVTEGR